MTTADLAKLMGATEADTAAFVSCLRVHLAKGLTLEQAIECHMQVLTNMVDRVVPYSRTPAAKALVVDTFFPA